jgi:pSer/pThr/pTyr-binding forkhead associated (FHA) protein
MEMTPAVLVEIRNHDEGPEHPVSSRVTYIGGSACNQIVLSDGGISRHHAKITFAEGKYYLEDLDSKLGTFVNGERSNGRSRIAHGDMIRLGEITLRFQLAGRPA